MARDDNPPLPSGERVAQQIVPVMSAYTIDTLVVLARRKWNPNYLIYTISSLIAELLRTGKTQLQRLSLKHLFCDSDVFCNLLSKCLNTIKLHLPS